MERLRNNPKIQYDSITNRYRFCPSYAIRSQQDLLLFLQTRPSLVVDGDLLECYKSINEDISDILAAKRVRALRQSDLDRTLKCERAAENLTPASDGKASKCSLYSEDRCSICQSNRGIVLMKRFEGEIPSASLDIKQYWSSVKFPHISEIHRITQSQSQHLLTTNTSQILSNKSTRKVRGGAKKAGPKFSWSDINANRVSNVHILSLLEQSSNPT